MPRVKDEALSCAWCQESRLVNCFHLLLIVEKHAGRFRIIRKVDAQRRTRQTGAHLQFLVQSSYTSRIVIVACVLPARIHTNHDRSSPQRLSTAYCGSPHRRAYRP